MVLRSKLLPRFCFPFSQLDNSENYLRRGNHNGENVSTELARGLACGGIFLMIDVGRSGISTPGQVILGCIRKQAMPGGGGAHF